MLVKICVMNSLMPEYNIANAGYFGIRYYIVRGDKVVFI